MVSARLNNLVERNGSFALVGKSGVLTSPSLTTGVRLYLLAHGTNDSSNHSAVLDKVTEHIRFAKVDSKCPPIRLWENACMVHEHRDGKAPRF
jgi:hypothetical protein